jgi:hypothetical protein
MRGKRYRLCDHYSRIVAKGPSQNAVAVVPSSAEPGQDLALIGHIDTQRTPLVFSAPRWVAAYKAFTTIAFVLFAAQAALYMFGVLAGWPWIWPATAPSAVGAVLLRALRFEADRTPFTAGADDNASAVGNEKAPDPDLLAGHRSAHAWSLRPNQHGYDYFTCAHCHRHNGGRRAGHNRLNSAGSRSGHLHTSGAAQWRRGRRPPSGGGSTGAATGLASATGAYTLDSGTSTESNKTYSATQAPLMPATGQRP